MGYGSTMDPSKPLFESTKTASDARVDALLPRTGSDDAVDEWSAYIVDVPELPTQLHSPHPAVQWTMTGRAPAAPIAKEVLREFFPRDHRKRYGGMEVFGTDETGATSLVFSGSSGGPYREVVLAFQYHRRGMYLSHDALPGDSVFSVSTSGVPGYFLPETIADGTAQIPDLRFAFWVTHAAAPEQIFEAMCAAAKYAARRLGGLVVASNADSLEEEADRMRGAVYSLRALGITPGHPANGWCG